MSEFGQNIRDMVSKGMEAIGSTASSIAAGTKQKMTILAINSRKRELFGILGEKIYFAWKQGKPIDSVAVAELKELDELELQIHSIESAKSKNDIAAEKSETEEKSVCTDSSYPIVPDSSEAGNDRKKNETDETDQPAIHESDMPEKPFADSDQISVETEDMNPLSSAINALFDQIPQVDQMADKVNASLNEMGEQLKQFSADLGKQIADMADELMGKNGEDL